MMLDQHAKRVEHLRAQRHGIAVVRETSLADFEPVGPELVHAARQGLMAFQKNLKKTERRLQDAACTSQSTASVGVARRRFGRDAQRKPAPNISGGET